MHPRRNRIGATALLLVVTPVVARPALAQHRSSLRSTAFVAQPSPDVRFPEPAGAPLALQPQRRSERKRVALQFVTSSVGAVSGGLAGYTALRNISETRVKGDEGYTRSGTVGYLLGSFVGTTLGAHLVGRSMGGKAPLWATSLGGLVGTLPLIALGVDEPYLPLFGVALGWIPQAALATGGFVMAEPR